MEEYFDKIVGEAKNAFWAKISKGFPEIKSGDVEPGELEEFDNKCIEVVNDWLINNI